MSKIKNIAELNKLRIEARSALSLDNSGDSPGKAVIVKVAMATCGIASGAKEVMEFFSDALEKRSIEAVVTQTGCMGYCYAEPTIEVTVPGKEAVVFGDVDVRKADEIIEQYIRKGTVPEGTIPMNYRTIDE